jgi:Kef-type K+ transport system membrane component KefB
MLLTEFGISRIARGVTLHRSKQRIILSERLWYRNFGLRVGVTALVLGLAAILPRSLYAATIEVQDTLVTSVGISIIAATVLAYVGALGKIPLLLSYLAAGALIGPRIGFGFISAESDIRAISEIGLVLLLFIIGLDIDIRKLKDSGKALLVAGGSQFVICVAFGLAFFSWLGFSLHQGNFEVLYLAVCCAISSTTLVAKLLYDKFELNTLPGQITLGVLLFQNIWVMLFFRIQPNLGQSVFIEAVLAVAKGASLVLVSQIGRAHV